MSVEPISTPLGNACSRVCIRVCFTINTPAASCCLLRAFLRLLDRPRTTSYPLTLVHSFLVLVRNSRGCRRVASVVMWGQNTLRVVGEVCDTSLAAAMVFTRLHETAGVLESREPKDSEFLERQRTGTPSDSRLTAAAGPTGIQPSFPYRTKRSDWPETGCRDIHSGWRLTSRLKTTCEPSSLRSAAWMAALAAVRPV